MPNTEHSPVGGFTLSGVVVKGNQLGRKLGFPTANLELPEGESFTAETGVYAVTAETGGKTYRGICNAGTRPTINGNQLTIEVHLFDYSGDLYGKKMVVIFLQKIRNEKKFNNLEELTDQIKKDRETAIRLFSGGN